MEGKMIWSRKLEFVLSMMSFAIGFGNIWRFPYLCYAYGGGAFLIPYVISLLIVGFPLMYLEIALGQFTGRDCYNCWDIAPIFRGAGIAGMCICCIIVIYYSLLLCIFIQYLFYSWRKNLLWMTCGHPWNINCSKGVASRQFFYRKILNETSYIGDQGNIRTGMCVTYAVVWFLTFVGLINSAKSIGKIAYITAICPYIIMTILLIRGATLKGSKEGIKFYMLPDISKLKSLTIWEKAANQIFFSMCTCCGAIITLSSYNKYNNNFLTDSIVVGFANSFTSFYSGFAIFSATGHLAYLSNKTIKEVAKAGTDLAFISYPASISALPGAQFWATIFYLMMFFLGFGTIISSTEGFTAPIENLVPNLTRKKSIAIRATSCFVCFLFGIPLTYNGGFYYVDVLDSGSSSGFLWVGLSELACLMYVYDHKIFSEEIKLMTGHRTGIMWKAVFLVITPLGALLMLIANYIKYKPAADSVTTTSRGIEMFLTLLCILPIPVWAVGHSIYCYLNKINIWKPSQSWIDRKKFSSSDKIKTEL